MYWPSDTLLVSNVARGAKRVAHPCSKVTLSGALIGFDYADNQLNSYLLQKDEKLCRKETVILDYNELYGLILFVRYNRANVSGKVKFIDIFVHYKREFVITVIVITELL